MIGSEEAYDYRVLNAKQIGDPSDSTPRLFILRRYV